MSVPILNSKQQWECPNCDARLVVESALPHSPFHPCGGLKGIQAPLVPAGTKCKVEAHEREDYVGKEVLTYDEDNRPIMAVEVTREEGNDVVVFAPCATPDGGVS